MQNISCKCMLFNVCHVAVDTCEKQDNTCTGIAQLVLTQLKLMSTHAENAM